MQRRLTTSVRSFTLAGIVLLGMTAASPALAANDNNLTCEGRQQFVRIEDKTCPATPNRPVTIVHRVCCMNPAGKVHCDGFRQCPNNSPS
jgi:hypothetical protein